MNLLTLARRADFGRSLSSRLGDARARLTAGVSFRELVGRSVVLDRTQNEFHESIYLTGIVSIAEALVTDLGNEFLVRYPGHIKTKDIPLDLLITLGSVGAVVESFAARTINEWAYGRFPELVNKVATLYDKNSSLDPDLLDDMSEIKATRDLFVHGAGVVNKIYLEKAGQKARAGRLGEKIGLGIAYLKHAEATISRLASDLEMTIPLKFKSMGKAAAFQSMWEATKLATFVPYDIGWVTEGADMIRPNNEGLEWTWSSSEKMLLDFFLGIYSEEYPSRKYDVLSALRRWPPTTDEGKVIMSWFDSPFWF